MNGHDTPLEHPHSGDALSGAKAWLAGIEVGTPLHHQNLTIFPLLHEQLRESPAVPLEKERYILLEDAIAADLVAVEEVEAGGSVPLLAVANNSSKPVLIPEGQILVGAKQNRTVNLTVLVASGMRFELPVSCVEQGRWSYVSRRFATAAYASPDLREKKIRSVQRRRAAGGGAFSDQREVWNSVDDQLQALQVDSPTHDVVEGQRAAAGRARDYWDHIRLPGAACGFLASSGGRVFGLDLFDAPGTLRKLWKQLAPAYFALALRDNGKEPVSEPAIAESFLDAVTTELAPAAEQPQLGFELELPGGEMAGTALWHDGAICHLAAFPVDGGAGCAEGTAMS